MTTRIVSRCRNALVVLWTAFVCGMPFSFAATPLNPGVKTFVIVPSESTIEASGSALGNSIIEQEPGSLETSFSGTIVADVTESAIEFLDASRIEVRTNGVWEPLPDGLPGKAPASFGGKVENLFVSGKAAARNIVLYVTSPPLNFGEAGIAVQDLLFSFVADSGASLDFSASGAFPGLPIAGSSPLEGSSTNRAAAEATIQRQGDVETLQIPVDVNFTFGFFAPEDSSLNFKGRIVAVRTNESAAAFASISVLSNRWVRLTWNAEPSADLRLESSIDLKSWAEVETGVLPSMSAVVWTNEVSGAAEFYRLAR